MIGTTRLAVVLAWSLAPAGTGYALPADGASAKAVFPSGAEFELEIAADPETRQRGYMYRERVGPREGMLFLFDGPGRHSIWMKNCLVSLDIIWLDPDFRVVEVAHDRPPCPETGKCAPMAPMRASRYVLEVAGGIAREQELQLGDRIRILPEPSPAP